jgi:leucyl-tRNA synthetase
MTNQKDNIENPQIHSREDATLNYNDIEVKWQKKWEEARVFEEEVNNKKSFMVVAAFPYVNSAQHIGHLRTFGTADVLARYKRMSGFNVLYPMGFHCTGIPILSFAKRIQKGDAELISEYKNFGVTDEDIKKMNDPNYIASYFSKEVEAGMRRAGFSVDWRKKFSTIDPEFSKFVEWQFGILNSKGFFVKGNHPLGWCTNENNAVGMHDTLHDVEPDIEKETVIKFKIENEDAYMICATYRPETVYGVTNIFVNKNISYTLCKINDFNAYVANDSISKLGMQMKIEVVGEPVEGSAMLEKKCVNPMTGDVVPVLPGFFVKGELGTGIVMSVPAHAPFDYAALERLKLEQYPLPEIKPVKVLEVDVGRSLADVAVGDVRPSQLDIPALAYLEILHTDVNAIEDMLEFATKLEYREESHWGKMTVKGYEGMSEPEARDRIKELLEKEGNAFDLYIIANAPVYCRCGTEVVVKIVDNQWFLNYGNAEWKKQVLQWFGEMSIYPDKLRNTFETAINWIDLRAVARAQGLGTKFPLDNQFIIESLSDSTVYMAFYTISQYIKGIDPEKLKPEFFDYVFNGKGDADAVAKNTGIDYAIIKKCRESFTYWYTTLSNHSGSDLVFNHLTMYIYNHIAVFNKEYWPKQTVTNGSVLYEGEKMSKSLGNIIPLSKAITEYGADPLRFVVIAGAELYSDSEFNVKNINGIKERIEYLMNIVDRIDDYEASELKSIDYWLYSKLNRKIMKCTDAMERIALRDASIEMLYNSVIELREYFEKGGKNQTVIKDYMQNVTLMMQPIAPHISEEIWHMLDNDTFVSNEKWPAYSKNMIDDKIEEMYNFIDNTIGDAKNMIRLISKKQEVKIDGIKFIIADDLKRLVNNELVHTRKPGEVIQKLKDEGKDPEKVADYVGKMSKRINELTEAGLSSDDEFKALNDAKEQIEKSLNCKVEIEKEIGSKSQRAAKALPMRPSIDISIKA